MVTRRQEEEGGEGVREISGDQVKYLAIINFCYYY